MSFVTLWLKYFGARAERSVREMAPMKEPLLDRSKLSMVYGVNEYEEMLRAKMAENSEIAQLKALSPDQEGPSASVAEGIMKSGTEADGKSKKGKREFPTPNKPDPMPRELEFLFTRISPEQMLYMWNVYTALFCAQCACVLAYCFMLSQGLDWYLATSLFSVPMAALMIQNVYILHDVLHGDAWCWIIVSVGVVCVCVLFVLLTESH